MWIIEIEGSLGLQYYGPFSSEKELEVWAKQRFAVGQKYHGMGYRWASSYVNTDLVDNFPLDVA